MAVPLSRDTAWAMSEENVKVVERAIAPLNERDIDGYLACCTEDIQLRTPLSPVAGVYERAVGIRRFSPTSRTRVPISGFTPNAWRPWAANESLLSWV